MELNIEQINDILDKMEFFQGQRAGRELWNSKPFAVQEQDIANFSRDVTLIKNYIKELTEELKAWQKLLILQQESADKAYYNLACEVEKLRAENEKLKSRVLEENHLRKQAEEMLALGMDEVKADTLQKYKSAIIEYYSKPKYQPTKEHPIKHTQIEYLFVVLDQTAKKISEEDQCQT